VTDRTQTNRDWLRKENRIVRSVWKTEEILRNQTSNQTLCGNRVVARVTAECSFEKEGCHDTRL
jgi:hypothetical protein